jgi:hypothetical protein
MFGGLFNQMHLLAAVYENERIRKIFLNSSGTLYWPSLSGDTLNESSLGATNLSVFLNCTRRSNVGQN